MLPWATKRTPTDDEAPTVLRDELELGALSSCSGLSRFLPRAFLKGRLAGISVQHGTTQEALSHIIANVPVANLEILKLSCVLMGKDVKTLLDLVSTSTLVTLDLSTCYCKGAFDALAQCRLRMLDLSDANLTLPTLKSVVRGVRNSPTLQVLCMRECKLVEEGIVDLFPEMRNTPLTVLDLGGNELSERAVTLLSEGLRGSRITALGLSRNKLSLPGCKALTKGLIDSNVRNLDLSYVFARHDPGCHHLIERLKETKVQRLDVRRTGLTCEFLQRLLLAVKESNLVEVRWDLAYCLKPEQQQLKTELKQVLATKSWPTLVIQLEVRKQDTELATTARTMSGSVMAQFRCPSTIRCEEFYHRLELTMVGAGTFPSVGLRLQCVLSSGEMLFPGSPAQRVTPLIELLEPETKRARR